MIIGLGIDAVEIVRFTTWSSLTPQQLCKLFSPEEIRYCLSCPQKSAERFAARFAVREACYKALTPLLAKKIPFLTLSKAIQISKNGTGKPQLTLNLPVQYSLKTYTYHLSITHTGSTAIALVIIES